MNKNFSKIHLVLLILFAGGVSFIVKAKWFSEGMEGLGYIILAMIILGGALLILITAIVIDVLKKYKLRKSSDLLRERGTGL